MSQAQKPKQEIEICGAPTSKGGKCQNAKESCPWHDENGNRTDVENGQKGKYNEETVSRIIEAAREGLPLKSCARAGNITEKTLYQWMSEKSDFSKKVKAARSEAERELAKLARDKDPRYILSRSYKWEKPKERKEVQETSKDMTDVQERLQEAYRERMEAQKDE